MGGDSGSTTTTQRVEPWGPMRPHLYNAAGKNDFMYRYGKLEVEPFRPGFNDLQHEARNMTVGAARRQSAAGQPYAKESLGTLSAMMDPDFTSRQLDDVKDYALDSAIPAAIAPFSGSGMTDSTLAMDTVGRAATDAVAPYAYGAHQNAQDRAVAAAGMAPGIEQQMAAQEYLPAQMIQSIGDSQMAEARRYHYEKEQAPIDEYQRYLSNVLGLSGMGSTTTGPSGQPSTLQRVGAGGLTGLGTYGALAATPAAPFAAPLAIGAGILGML